MLKSYLRNLLDAFIKNKRGYISEQASPNYSSVVFYVVTSFPYTFTPPSDGIFSIRGEHTSGTPFIDIEVYGTRFTEIQWSYGYGTVFLPVKAGVPVLVNSDCSSASARFVSTTANS